MVMLPQPRNNAPWSAKGGGLEGTARRGLCKYLVRRRTGLGRSLRANSLSLFLSLSHSRSPFRCGAIEGESEGGGARWSEEGGLGICEGRARDGAGDAILSTARALIETEMLALVRFPSSSHSPRLGARRCGQHVLCGSVCIQWEFRRLLLDDTRPP